MAKRNIVQDGDPVLKKASRPVARFDDRLGVLIDDMKETLLEANGLGLAAPQVGVLRRVFVALDISDEPDEDATEEEMEAWEPRVVEFINPEIVETDGEILGYEGCLSFPGEYGAVKRPQRVKIRAFDREGKPFEMEVEDMMARCMCHETDHLNGVTFDTLAEYFYDPETPHDLDDEMEGRSPDPEEN